MHSLDCFEDRLVKPSVFEITFLVEGLVGQYRC